MRALRIEVMPNDLKESARILGAQGGRALSAKMSQGQRSMYMAYLAHQRWKKLSPDERSAIGRARQQARMAKAKSGKEDHKGKVELTRRPVP